MRAPALASILIVACDHAEQIATCLDGALGLPGGPPPPLPPVVRRGGRR